MNQQEWIEYFELVNGRKPTPAELSQAQRNTSIIKSNGSILLSLYCVENYGYQNVIQQKRMLKADESMN